MSHTFETAASTIFAGYLAELEDAAPRRWRSVAAEQAYELDRVCTVAVREALLDIAGEMDSPLTLPQVPT